MNYTSIWIIFKNMYIPLKSKHTCTWYKLLLIRGEINFDYTVYKNICQALRKLEYYVWYIILKVYKFTCILSTSLPVCLHCMQSVLYILCMLVLHMYILWTDTFEAPIRPVEKPFRCSVADIFKGMLHKVVS